MDLLEHYLEDVIRLQMRGLPPRQAFFAALSPSYGAQTSPSGAAGGDLAGTYPNPTVGLLKVTAAKMSSGAAASGQAPLADGSGGVAYGTVGGGWSALNRVLRGSAGVVSISSISQSFAHLVLVGKMRANDGSATLLHSLQFNGDTGSNYSAQETFSSGATVTGATVSGTSMALRETVGTGSAANIFSNFVIWLPNYTQTGQKLALIQTFEQSAPKYSVIGGKWTNTGAINQVDFIHAFGTSWDVGTCVDVYGVAAGA